LDNGGGRCQVLGGTGRTNGAYGAFWWSHGAYRTDWTHRTYGSNWANRTYGSRLNGGWPNWANRTIW